MQLSHAQSTISSLVALGMETLLPPPGVVLAFLLRLFAAGVAVAEAEGVGVASDAFLKKLKIEPFTGMA